MKNIEFEPIRGANATTVENQIRAERTVVPEISPIPAVIETVVVEHVEPVVAKPPMVLPEVIMEKPKVSVVHEVIHTTDPVLLMIERDLQYSKRMLVN